MRELPRDLSGRPLALPPGEAALRAAELLRVGWDEDGLDLLTDLTGRVGGLLKGPGGAAVAGEVLGLLQEVSLCQARGDLVALADLVQYRLAPRLASLG